MVIDWTIEALRSVLLLHVSNCLSGASCCCIQSKLSVRWNALGVPPALGVPEHRILAEEGSRSPWRLHHCLLLCLLSPSIIISGDVFMLQKCHLKIPSEWYTVPAHHWKLWKVTFFTGGNRFPWRFCNLSRYRHQGIAKLDRSNVSKAETMSESWVYKVIVLIS